VKFVVETDRIGVSDEITIFAVQVGLTRIGAGGRVTARNGRGQLVPTHRLVPIYREHVETFRLVSPPATATLSDLPLTSLVLALTLRYSLARPSTPSPLALKSRRVLATAVGFFVPDHVRGRSLGGRR